MSTRTEDLVGNPPGQTPRNIVLRHYSLVEGARRRGWRWRQIGEALGLTESSMKRAFARIHRQVQAGRIDPEALKGPPVGTPAPTKRRQTPETRTRPQAEEQNSETLRAMGVEIIGESK